MTMPRTASFMLCLFGMALCAAALEQGERLQFADGLYSRGMYEMAATEYQTFLDANQRGEGVDTALYRLGESLLNTGRRREAEAAFKKVVFDYPKSPFRHKAGFRAAELAAEAGRADQAANQWEAILESAPPPDMAAATLYRLGTIRAREGNTAAAVRSLSRIKSEFSSSPFYAHALLALAGLTAGSPAEKDNAAAMLRAAATNTTSPRLAAEALFQLGELEFRRDAWAPSLSAYQQLITKYPGDERAREAGLQVAWAQHHLGRQDEVLKTCETAASAPGAAQSAEWLYLKANALRQLKRYENAVQTYRQLLDRWPDDTLAPSAAYEQVLSMFKAARYQEAAATAAKLKPKQELKADVTWIMAESFEQLKETDKAIQHYRSIVEQYPTSPLRQHAWQRWAHILQTKDEFEAAAKQYAAALQAYPAGDSVPQALFASAYCLSRLGRHAEAVRDWSALIQRFPDNVLAEESLYQKSTSLLHLKQDEQALAAFAQLLRQFPRTRFAAEANYWSGTIHEAAGRLAEAEIAYRAGLSANGTGETASRGKLRLAVTLQRLGKPEESAKLLDSLVTSGITAEMTPELLEWLAGTHLDRSEYKAAMEAATTLTTRPDGAKRALPWLVIARCRRALNQRADALQAYDKAMTLAGPGRIGAEAAIGTGELALESGAIRQAGSAYDKAIAFAAEDRFIPLRAAAYVGKGRVLRAGGKTEDAGRAFMSVAILFDDAQLVPESLYEAARCFKESGKHAESAKALDELRKRFPNSDWIKKIDQPGQEEPRRP
jgi:TolA-binding protein